MVKENTILKVLRMGLPIVENLSELQDNIFSPSRSSELPFAKTKKNKNKLFPFPLLAHVGPMAVWGFGLLLFLHGVGCWVVLRSVLRGVPLEEEVHLDRHHSRVLLQTKLPVQTVF